MAIRYLVCGILLAASTLASCASTTAPIPVGNKWAINIEPAAFPKNSGKLCDELPNYDAFIAKASIDGKLVADIDFCAAYGNSKAYGFTDKIGRNYVLIERDTMRGTGATFYDLDIYRIESPDNFKIMTIPVEEPAGQCHLVTYLYTVADGPSGGLALTLQRQIYKFSTDCSDKPDVPVSSDTKRIIFIDIPK